MNGCLQYDQAHPAYMSWSIDNIASRITVVMREDPIIVRRAGEK